MLSLKNSIIALALVVSAPMIAVAGELFELEGGIRKVTIGGVETAARTGYAVGNQVFVVDGPMAPAVEASVGQHLLVKGIVYRRMGIGGETAPKLIVGELALARVDTSAATFRVAGCLKSNKVQVQIGSLSFKPAGPLASALLALDGCEIEITGEKNPVPVPAAAESIFITSIGKRDITKAPAAK